MKNLLSISRIMSAESWVQVAIFNGVIMYKSGK